MLEMTFKNSSMNGVSMKKMTLVAVLVALIVLATAAMAFANGAGPFYQSWTAATTTAANAGSANSPHADYRLTTIKCAVCHSVHGAATATSTAPNAWSPLAITGPTQLLLRSSAANACNYCHIQTQIGVFQIYGGDATKYATTDGYNHAADHGAGCTNCHAVHGANTFKGDVSAVILRVEAPANPVGNDDNQIQSEANVALSAAMGSQPVTNAVGYPQLQVTAFCTQCHKVFSSTSETTITAYGFWNPTFSDTWMSTKEHPLRVSDPTTATSVSNRATSGATVGANTRVAWVDAQACRSCHQAGYDAPGLTMAGGTALPGGGLYWSTFPHYTPQRQYFLTAGFGSGDVTNNTPNLIPAGSGTATTNANGFAVTNGNIDGICLKCHTNGTTGSINATQTNSNGTAGVGITF